MHVEGQEGAGGVIGKYSGAAGIHTVGYPLNIPVNNVSQLTHVKFIYLFVISVTNKMVHFFPGRTELLSSINASNGSSTIKIICSFKRLSFLSSL